MAVAQVKFLMHIDTIQTHALKISTNAQSEEERSFIDFHFHHHEVTELAPHFVKSKRVEASERGVGGGGGILNDSAKSNVR